MFAGDVSGVISEADEETEVAMLNVRQSNKQKHERFFIEYQNQNKVPC